MKLKDLNHMVQLNQQILITIKISQMINYINFLKNIFQMLFMYLQKNICRLYDFKNTKKEKLKIKKKQKILMVIVLRGDIGMLKIELFIKIFQDINWFENL